MELGKLRQELFLNFFFLFSSSKIQDENHGWKHYRNQSITMITDQILFQQFDLVLCSLYTDAAIFLMTGMSYAFWHTFSVICEVSSLFFISLCSY